MTIPALRPVFPGWPAGIGIGDVAMLRPVEDGGYGHRIRHYVPDAELTTAHLWKPGEYGPQTRPDCYPQAAADCEEAPPW